MTKVLIVFGGNSSEHSISCISAKSIVTNIDLKTYKVTLCGISKDNIWYTYDDDFQKLDDKWLKKKIHKIDNIIEFLKEFDIVFPMIHGNTGEDGKLQGMLDLFNIKYVGSNCLTSSMGMDKDISKIVFNSLNIKQVKYLTIDNKFNTSNIKQCIKYPMIVKPANGGSSIGISKVTNDKELKKAIKLALKYDSKIIVEEFIQARELEIAILGNNDKKIVSQIGEIIPCNSFYDYNAKYKQTSNLIIPADINKDTEEEIKKIADKIYDKFAIKDYVRIDFFLDNDDIYINEINTIPGFTEISMFPKLIMNEGYSYKEVISMLIKNALKSDH